MQITSTNRIQGPSSHLPKREKAPEDSSTTTDAAADTVTLSKYRPNEKNVKSAAVALAGTGLLAVTSQLVTAASGNPGLGILASTALGTGGAALMAPKSMRLQAAAAGGTIGLAMGQLSVGELANPLLVGGVTAGATGWAYCERS